MMREGVNPVGSRLRWLVVACVCALLCACGDMAARYREPAVHELVAQRWEEAEGLFRSDDRWLGGDGAYSVDLGASRVLWLFGDSFIGRGYSRERKGALIIRNSIAIQRGYDPAKASAAFYWSIANNRPEAFFTSPGPHWYWPGSGIVAQGRLLVFLMEIREADNELGFAAAGWTAVLVENPAAEPSRWKIRRIETPNNEFGVILGSAGSLVREGYVYAFGTHAATHDAYLARWRLSDAANGNLMRPQWWVGQGGWVEQDRLVAPPEPVFAGAQMEFSVHYEPAMDRFLAIQTGSFAGGCLAYRSAPSLTGPWSEKTSFYCPGSPDRDSRLLFYAGKAHPCLKGADLVCTYAINSLDEQRILESHDLYYPVFVRVTLPGRGDVTAEAQ
jgi:hypothetical protein